MTRTPAHIIAAISLALVLLFAGTPPDFIHQFAGHEDTVHAKHSDHKVAIEQQHHHCKYLSFVLDVFTPNTPQVIHITPVKEYFTVAFLFKESIIQRCIVATCLRGPPMPCQASLS